MGFGGGGAGGGGGGIFCSGMGMGWMYGWRLQREGVGEGFFFSCFVQKSGVTLEYTLVCAKSSPVSNARELYWIWETGLVPVYIDCFFRVVEGGVYFDSL